MKTICIGDYISAISEKTTENNQHIVLTSSRNGIFIQNEYFNKKVASVDTTGYKIIRKGQFTYRAMSDTGRFYINRLKEYNIGIVSPAYPVFEVKKNDSLYPEYLLAFFHSPYFQSLIATQSTGSTRVSLKLDKIKKIKLSVPPLDVQRRIAETLDKVTELISLRKTQLEKLDELVKARFVELFGTLDYPVQEFKKATLKELCTKITDGKHGGCTQEEGTERYFVGAREIYDNAVHYDTAPEINLAEFEKDYKRCNVEIGDFLIVNTGATIGKSAIAIDPRTEYTLLQKSVALLKAKRELLNPVFLQYCYKVNEKMYKVESASAQPNLLLSKINSTKIYVPPIELQNQFAAFVEQTDKSKVIIQQSLDTLETLKKSLMQEYFG